MMAVAVFLADAIGIIGLIAQGYGMLSYAFIAILVIPLLTIGVRRILTQKTPSDLQVLPSNKDKS